MAGPSAKQSVVNPLTTIFLIVFLIPFNILHDSHAAPVHTHSSNECSIKCRPGQGAALSSFEPGEYVYEYESDVRVQLGAQGKSTKTKAKVTVTAHSSCDLVLRVQKIVMQSSSGQEEQLSLDSPVRFTLEDGVIGTVCITKDDPTYAANIKRAIISLLQNKGSSDSRVLESDLSGRCPTQYTVSGDTYVKSKNLNACTHREGGLIVSHGVPYEVTSERNSVPSVVATQNCEQTVEGGILKSVNCTEVHRTATLRPLAETELTTRVQVTLTLTNKRKDTAKIALPANLVKSSIYYDYADSSSDERHQAADKTARSILDKLCDQIRPDGVALQC